MKFVWKLLGLIASIVLATGLIYQFLPKAHEFLLVAVTITIVLAVFKDKWGGVTPTLLSIFAWISVVLFLSTWSYTSATVDWIGTKARIYAPRNKFDPRAEKVTPLVKVPESGYRGKDFPQDFNFDPENAEPLRDIAQGDVQGYETLKNPPRRVFNSTANFAFVLENGTTALVDVEDPRYNLDPDNKYDVVWDNPAFGCMEVLFAGRLVCTDCAEKRGECKYRQDSAKTVLFRPLHRGDVVHVSGIITARR